MSSRNKLFRYSAKGLLSCLCSLQRVVGRIGSLYIYFYIRKNPGK